MSTKTVSAIVIGEEPHALEAAIACGSLRSAYPGVVSSTTSQRAVPVTYTPDAELGYESILSSARSGLKETGTRVRGRLEEECVARRVDAPARPGCDLYPSLAAACHYSGLVVLPVPDGMPSWRAFWSKSPIRAAWRSCRCRTRPRFRSTWF